jgi:thermitase
MRTGRHRRSSDRSSGRRLGLVAAGLVIGCTVVGGPVVLGPGAYALVEQAAGPAVPPGPTGTAAAAADGTTLSSSTAGQLVVKLAPGADLAALNRKLRSTTRSALLASHSVYLLDVPLQQPSKDPAKLEQNWAKQAERIVRDLSTDPAVVYAEVNTQADITEGNRFHYWPSGGPSCVGSESSLYTDQAAATRLTLAEIHRTARGKGAVIAVLDTGADVTQPALAGRIAPGGYDYVDDDAVPDEVRDGTDHDGDLAADEGYGHGTFVAGIATLVAPEAEILPERVLDADGRGNIFVVVEAIYDAIKAHANVINMSFGTADKVQSKVLQEAIMAATKKGVVITAAAGNDGSTVAHYPAAMSAVVAVAAQAADSSALADFSARGDWVDVAAPGERIISTLPCGYGSWSGTSMASPFVAGAAAVLEGLHPGMKADKIVKAIDEGSDKVRGMKVRSGAINLGRSIARV